MNARDETDFDALATPMREAIWQAQGVCRATAGFVRDQIGESVLEEHGAAACDIRNALEAASALLDRAIEESNKLTELWNERGEA